MLEYQQIVMEDQQESGRLLHQVRDVLRLHHYSIHTERSYVDWIKRYVQFHKMSSREDLADRERKIEAFLTDLAVRGKVAASTQNQAMNASASVTIDTTATPPELADAFVVARSGPGSS